MKEIILSCTQPTDHLHLGNYLGAIKNFAALQKNSHATCLYGVVDLHAITLDYDRALLAQRTREIAAAYIACGIDYKRSILFVQSAIPQHSQLMWLLSSVTQMGKLERMTQFKDKAGKNSQRAGLGLFAYPVLMAADILLYKATRVPVGDDQRQHLELARDIAATFNHKYEQEFFPLPTGIIKSAARVMSLKDASKKMSKSDPSELSRISLIDDAQTIEKKIKKAKTDAGDVPSNEDELEGRAEAKNLITIYSAMSGLSDKEVMAKFGGGRFSDFKTSLSELLITELSPITEKMNALLQNPSEIDKILENGNEKARAIASKTLSEVQDIMGFWRA